MSAISVRAVVGVILGVSFYLQLFWRTAVANRGNKLVESGCLAVLFFMLFAYSSRVPKFPVWLALCFVTLAFLLCLTTLFFAGQRAYNALRKRKIAN
jgi:hypothetical protein